jgi:hypothetical protein
MLAGGHERGAVHPDGVTSIVFFERNRLAAGCQCLVERGPFLHKRLSLWFGNLRFDFRRFGRAKPILDRAN